MVRRKGCCITLSEVAGARSAEVRAIAACTTCYRARPYGVENMQTRRVDFYDVKAMRPKYGIKVKAHDGRWINAGDENGLFLFDTEAERDAKRKELSKMPLPSAL